MRKIFTILLVLLLSVFTVEAQKFSDIFANIVQVDMGTVAWGDIDNDGDADLFICGEEETGNLVSILYENEGNDVFSEMTGISLPGLSTGDAQWGDFNNDGYIDLLLQGYDGANNYTRVFKNNGDKTFTETASNLSQTYMGAVCWVDFNNDNFLDIAITGFVNEDPWFITKLYKNNGDETFTELAGTNFPGMNYGKMKWADYNNDTYMDFILTGWGDNYFTEIFTNNGDETFTQSTISLHQGWLGDVAWADYDNDENIDLIISGTGGDGTERFTVLYNNNGDGTFSETADVFTGVSHSSLEWADFDFDGDLDLYISGTPGDPGIGDYVSSIYLNKNNVFSLDTSFAPNYWGDVQAFDYNNDNLPDLVISGLNNNEEGFAAIFKNTTPMVSLQAVNKILSISPIPAISFINVENTDVINKISIIDVEGRVVVVCYPNVQKTTINTQNITPGVYVINVQTKNENISRKIIIN